MTQLHDIHKGNQGIYELSTPQGFPSGIIRATRNDRGNTSMTPAQG